MIASPQLAPLILVVGPSGAGKDSLIDGARKKLAQRPCHFVRRTVTRGACMAEDNDSVSRSEFRRLQAEGGFLLSWDAHGLSYGVPRHVANFRIACILERHEI